MPIRFVCPHCRQKLSVSSRKAGLTADCPRCQRTLTIPELSPEAESAAAPEAAEILHARILPEGAGQGEGGLHPVVDVAVEDVQRIGPHAKPLSLGEGIEFAPSRPAPQPAGVEPVFSPDARGGFEGLELIYDAPASRASVAAPPVAADLIAVPRYAIYLQGGLLAVVAFAAFVIGLVAGGTLLSGPSAPPAPQACLISGNITYSSGPRQLPDEGAVVAVIPQTQSRPDEKAPIEGLRPGDPSPDANHRGLAILRELGGGYTRADVGGRFQIQVPSGGRYLVLVISREKQARSADDVQTTDILKLGPYFVNAADLLGDRRYQLTQETLRGDKQLQIAFQ